MNNFLAKRAARWSIILTMNILVIGRRGNGKSTLSLFIGRRIQEKRSGHTIAIFDPKRTFNSVAHTSDLDEFEELLQQNSDAVSFQPYRNPDLKNRSTDDVSEQFNQFVDRLGIERHFGVMEGASRPDLGPVVVIADESWFLQAGQRVNPSLDDMVRLADEKNFFLIQTAHRPNDIAPKIRAQANELYLFRQWLDDDVQIIETWSSPEVAHIVSTLPKHHVVRYEVDAQKFELWNDPTGWYTDLKGKGEGNETAENNSSGTERRSYNAVERVPRA